MRTPNLFIDQFEEVTNGKHSNCRFCNTAIHEHQTTCPYCDMPVNGQYPEEQIREDLHDSDRFLPVYELQTLHILDLLRLLAYTRQQTNKNYRELVELYDNNVDPLDEKALLVRNDYTQNTCAREILKRIIKDRMGYVPQSLTVDKMKQLARKMNYLVFVSQNGKGMYHIKKNEPMKPQETTKAIETKE